MTPPAPSTDRSAVLQVFEALSSGVRLDAFRLLVQAGRQGRVAGELEGPLTVCAGGSGRVWWCRWSQVGPLHPCPLRDARGAWRRAVDIPREHAQRWRVPMAPG